MKTCNKPNCTGKSYARGMCVKHYSKWFRALEVKPTKPKARELVLEALPGTAAEIEKKTELCADSVKSWLKKLRGSEVYIKGWQANGPGRAAIYAEGQQEDAPCTIPAMNSSEYSKRHRALHTERVRQRQRTYYAINKAKSKKATWASALGVMA